MTLILQYYPVTDKTTSVGISNEQKCSLESTKENKIQYNLMIKNKNKERSMKMNMVYGELEIKSNKLKKQVLKYSMYSNNLG